MQHAKPEHITAANAYLNPSSIHLGVPDKESYVPQSTLNKKGRNKRKKKNKQQSKSRKSNRK